MSHHTPQNHNNTTTQPQHQQQHNNNRLVKLGASQSPVQSDTGQNYYMSRAGRLRLEVRFIELVYSVFVLLSRTILLPCNTSGPLSEGNGQDAEPQALVAGVGAAGSAKSSPGDGGGDGGRRWWRRPGKGKVRVDSVRDGVLLVPCAVDVFL